MERAEIVLRSQKIAVRWATAASRRRCSALQRCANDPGYDWI